MLDVLVEVEHASRVYYRGRAKIEALALATCGVMAGDRIAIMGPSGSGKSTLLYLMAGLDAPSSGQIQWPALGSVETLRPKKIGVVFQSASLVPSLSVAENVELPLILSGDNGQASAKAMDALSRFGLAHLADKLPEALSGGQAQRVAIARAVVAEPRVILADEPTGQLDQLTAQSVMDTLLAWLGTSGAALVVATHDRAIADRLDRVWLMDHGHLTMPPER